MQSANLDQKITNFLHRKQVESFDPLSGREGSRTVKYAESLRTQGQLLFIR
jgi:hypothetical protein